LWGEVALAGSRSNDIDRKSTADGERFWFYQVDPHRIRWVWFLDFGTGQLFLLVALNPIKLRPLISFQEMALGFWHDVFPPFLMVLIQMHLHQALIFTRFGDISF
jgi:hypothetical protein